jgi:hypothetical protein
MRTLWHLWLWWRHPERRMLSGSRSYARYLMLAPIEWRRG